MSMEQLDRIGSVGGPGLTCKIGGSERIDATFGGWIVVLALGP